MLRSTLNWIQLFCNISKYPYVITKKMSKEQVIFVSTGMQNETVRGCLEIVDQLWSEEIAAHIYQELACEIRGYKRVELVLNPIYNLYFWCPIVQYEEWSNLKIEPHNVEFWDYQLGNDHLDMGNIEFEETHCLSETSQRYLLAKNHQPLKKAIKGSGGNEISIIGAFWAYVNHVPKHIHITLLSIDNQGNRFGIYEIETNYDMSRVDQLDFLYLDPMTKLPNIQYYQALYFASEKAQDEDCEVGLLVLNVMNLDTAINTFGKKQVLTFFRALKREVVRISKSANLFMVSSHVFGIFIEDATDEVMTEIAAGLIEEFKTPWYFDQFVFYSNIHIGMSSGSKSQINPMELLQQASLAMNERTDFGNSSMQQYAAEIKEKEMTRLRLQGEIKTAIDNSEFELFYQPQVNPHTHKIHGVEALIRWRHPERGLVPPNLFLPTAEEVGTIYMIDQMVVHKCAEMQVKLDQHGYGNVDVSVNISSVSLNSEVLDREIIDIVDMYGANPKQMVIEITESVKIFDSKKALILLNNLRKHGFRIALDDFGTGYSSLNYLSKLPIDILKIDKVYVDDFIHLPDIKFLIGKIIEISDYYGFEIIAEGIETQKQVKEIQEFRQGDLLIQGYYYHKPMPESDLLKCLERVGGAGS